MLTGLRTQLTTDPKGFFIRQLYRLVCIMPFVALVRLWSLVARVWPRPPLPQVPYVVFITSVIHPAMHKTVSFGAVRSTYTPEERLAHTVESIKSVRQHIPGAHVVLVEGGLVDVSGTLAPLVETYLYLGKQRLVRWACDGTSKSLGEAVMLFLAAKKVSVQAPYYFKLSGRYVLNETFDLSAWSQTGFSFLVLRPDFFSTRLYGFAAPMFKRWKDAVLMGMPYHLIDYPVENTLMRFVPKRFLQRLSHLGVSGLGGSSNDQIRE